MCVCSSGSVLLSQSCDEVLQWLNVLWLQQGMLPAEEREVCKECVEVRMQAQCQSLSIVRPVNVSESSEKQQKHFLDKKDEACREHRTWKRGIMALTLKLGWDGDQRGVNEMRFTCFSGKHIFISQ